MVADMKSQEQNDDTEGGNSVRNAQPSGGGSGRGLGRTFVVGQRYGDASGPPCPDPNPSVPNPGMQYGQHDGQEYEAWRSRNSDQRDVPRSALRRGRQIDGSQRHGDQQSQNRNGEGENKRGRDRQPCIGAPAPGQNRGDACREPFQ